MSAAAALAFMLDLDAAHARLRRKLDDELGTLHGLSLQDFVLLRALAHAPDGRLTAAQLQPVLGVPASSVVRQVLALEKTGWVAREAEAMGERTVVLRGAGRGVLHEAEETAALISAAALRACPPAGVAPAAEVLRTFAASAALELR